MTASRPTDGFTLFLIEPAMALRLRQLRMLGSVPQVNVVGSGAEVAVALPQLLALRPKVVLVGVHPASESVKAVQRLAQSLPGSHVIVMADAGSSALRRAYVRAGAAYCFDRTLEVEELRAALRSMSRSAAVCQP